MCRGCPTIISPLDSVRLIIVKALWPTLLPVVRSFCDDPAEWPILFAIATQESIFMAKDVIEPGLAVTVVMESAVPMSKIDLPEFYQLD